MRGLANVGRHKSKNANKSANHVDTHFVNGEGRHGKASLPYKTWDLRVAAWFEDVRIETQRWNEPVTVLHNIYISSNPFFFLKLPVDRT